MDRHNYTLLENKIQEGKKKFGEIIEKILIFLKIHEVVQRKRLVKEPDILLNAAFLMIQKTLSYRRLAIEMSSKYGITMSAMAWKKQMNKIYPVLLEAINEVTKQDAKSDAVYLIDTTEVPTEGQKNDSARVHTCYNMDSKTIDRIKITDQHTAETVRNFSDIHANCTYIADKAYGISSQIAYIFEKKANFLFRISPSHIKLYIDKECKEKIILQSLLENCTSDTLDMFCYTPFKGKVYKIRIVAKRIPDDKREAAVERAVKTAKRKQQKIMPKTILFGQWLILASSLTLSPEELASLYQKRWQIELLFKRTKTLFNFHRLHRCKKGYMIQQTSIWFSLIILASALLDMCSWDESPFEFFSVFCSFWA